MTTERDLLRLMAWLSPAFPVGAFGYSHGLETAIRDGRIARGQDLCGWLTALLSHGAPWTDAVVFKAAWEAWDDPAALADVAELALALAPSLERRRESVAQGEAFLAAVKAWRPHVTAPFLVTPAERSESRGQGFSASVVDDEHDPAPGPGYAPRAFRDDEREIPYSVAVGATCGAHGLPLDAALAAWLHAFSANLVSAAVRLVPLGQRAGVAVIAGLEDTILTTTRRAAASTLDDLGSAGFLSDIAAMRHETLDARIFVT